MQILPKISKNQSGAVHFLPLLLVVVAIGIISYLLISSTLPTGGLFGILNPKPPSKAAGEGFLETFAYGVFSAPTPFRSPRWIVGYGGNQNGDTNAPDGSVIRPPIEAGHGPNCQAPMGNSNPNLNIHLLQNTSTVDLVTYYRDHAPQQFFICNNHMMTINKSGGDALFFMPRYLLDWSGGRTANLQFDTNPDGWARNWWEVYIAPQEELLFSANFSKRAVIFSNVSHHFQIRRIANYNISQRDDPGTGYCSATADPACTDPRIRRTHKISFNTTNWSMSVVKPDGTLFTQSGTWDAPLDFTSGMILMTHYNYNPTKDGIPVNPSMITYHWANFLFDGPATRLMTGYPAPPQYVTTVTHSLNGRPAGRNPSEIMHINVTSSDLRNPRIWGTLEGREGCGNSGCPDPTHTDPKDTGRWAEVSLNGGPYMLMPSIREVGALNQPYPNDTGMSWQTNIPADYPNPVRQGDNTLQFRANNYIGFQIHTVEIQVDPNSDLPPANSGGTGGIEIPGPTNVPAPTAAPTTPPATTTPTAAPTTAPAPTATATPRPTATATPRPTATPTPPPIGGPAPTTPPVVPPAPTQQPGGTPAPIVGRATVGFDDPSVTVQDVVLNGPYNIWRINWGTNNWYLSGPWEQFTTKSFSFNGINGVSSSNFNLLVPAHVESIQAYNGGTLPSTVTLSCPGQTTRTVTVTNGASPMTIQTGWSGSCTNISMSSSNGWNTNFDTLVLADPSTNPIVATVPPTIAPTTPPNTGQTTTITFDTGLNFANRTFTGQYPTGVIDWGGSDCLWGNNRVACWYLSAPWRSFKTKSFSFNGPFSTASFRFMTPRTMISVIAYNGGTVSSNVTLRCDGAQPMRSYTVGVNQIVTLNTGWTTPCSRVTMSSSNGWNTNFDDLIIR